MKYIIINNERIKARGSKYFNYHGKRLLIDEYLEKNSIKNTPPKDDTGDTGDTGDTIDTKDTGKSEIINNIPPPENTLLVKSDVSFSGMNVTFNDKDGGINIEVGKEPEKEKHDLNKGRADKRVTSESHNIVGEGYTLPDTENSFSFDVVKSIAPFALVGMGLLMVGKKGRKDGFREDNGDGEW